MVDLNPFFSSLLQSIAPVELTFPDADSQYPLITISQLDNNAVEVFEGKERLSQHEWQIDLWDDGKTPKRVMELAELVNARLIEHGMIRYFGKPIRDASGKQRYCMRVRFQLDERTGYVHKK